MDKKWADMEIDCPIDISRIKQFSREFESNIPQKINLENLNQCKESLLNARGNFNSMVASLVQNLYQREVLKNAEDKILYEWLSENLARYLKRLDDEEFSLIIKLDDPDPKESNVGIARISSYAKLLSNSFDVLIYEPLFKSTEEYKKIEKLEDKTPRAFLYILFQLIQITISVFGGLTREKSTSKKTSITTFPTSWQGLMTKQGGDLIKKGYQQDTGVDVSKLEEDFKLLEDLEVDEDVGEIN